MHRSEKLVCLAPLLCDTVSFVAHAGFNPNYCAANSFVVSQSNANGRVAQLEVDTRSFGTCRRERNSKRTLAQTLAQLRNLLKWTLADTCSSVTLAHLDICSHGLHWALATTRPTTTTTTTATPTTTDSPPTLILLLLLLIYSSSWSCTYHCYDYPPPSLWSISSSYSSQLDMMSEVAQAKTLPDRHVLRQPSTTWT